MGSLRRIWQYFEALSRKPRSAMIQFSAGAITFFCGMLGIYAVEHKIEPSLTQEIYTLICIIIAAIGFIIAFSAYLCLMISRFRNL